MPLPLVFDWTPACVLVFNTTYTTFISHKIMSSRRMFLSFLISIALPQVLCNEGQHLPPLETLDYMPAKDGILQPCETCRVLVESFLKGVESTSRGTFAGGDAWWEENKLGNYADSELRFIEIQEQLCSEVKKGKDQCHSMAEKQEDDLENWFYEHQKLNVDLLWYLCIDHLKICCPDNTYGPKCQPCPGGDKSPCSDHGNCQGNGTRAGIGICLCDAGYTGELCDQCQKGYYYASNSSFLTCEKCDHSCKDHCRGPGPQSCEICADGFQHVPEQGCVDHFKSKAIEEEDSGEADDKEDTKSTIVNFDSMNVQGSQHLEF